MPEAVIDVHLPTLLATNEATGSSTAQHKSMGHTVPHTDGESKQAMAPTAASASATPATAAATAAGMERMADATGTAGMPAGIRVLQQQAWPIREHRLEEHHHLPPAMMSMQLHEHQHHQPQQQQPQQQQREDESSSTASQPCPREHQTLNPTPLRLLDDRYELKRVQVTSEDGTSVPLTLVSLRELPTGLPGRRPALLEAYGAYGEILPLTWQPASLALVDRGWTLAFAHTR